MVKICSNFEFDFFHHKTFNRKSPRSLSNLIMWEGVPGILNHPHLRPRPQLFYKFSMISFLSNLMRKFSTWDWSSSKLSIVGWLVMMIITIMWMNEWFKHARGCRKNLQYNSKSFLPPPTTTHPLVFYPPKMILTNESLSNLLVLFKIVISSHELIWWWKVGGKRGKKLVYVGEKTFVFYKVIYSTP